MTTDTSGSLMYSSLNKASIIKGHKWRIQDFPRGSLLSGIIFRAKCMKMKKNGLEEGSSLARPEYASSHRVIIFYLYCIGGSRRGRRGCSPPLVQFFSLFGKNLVTQECIPVGCVPPTLYRKGVPLPRTETTPRHLPRQRPPLDRDPIKQRPHWTETSLDRDPPP